MAWHFSEDQTCWETIIDTWSKSFVITLWMCFMLCGRRFDTMCNFYVVCDPWAWCEVWRNLCVWHTKNDTFLTSHSAHSTFCSDLWLLWSLWLLGLLWSSENSVCWRCGWHTTIWIIIIFHTADSKSCCHPWRLSCRDSESYCGIQGYYMGLLGRKYHIRLLEIDKIWIFRFENRA